VTARPEYAPLGLPLGGRETGHREIDRGADRGAPHKRAWCGEDRSSDGAGIFLVANFGPVDDDLLILLARPFDKAHPDGPVGPAVDRGQDARIVQRRRIALTLQLELWVIDAARYIGGEDDLEIPFGGPQPAATGEEDQKQYGCCNSVSHRTSLLFDAPQDRM